MSKLPKSKSTPKPAASYGGEDDIFSPEHQSLLDLVWGNLEKIIPQYLEPDDDWIKHEIDRAKKEYLEGIQERLASLEEIRNTPQDILSASGMSAEKIKLRKTQIPIAIEQAQDFMHKVRFPQVNKDLIVSSLDEKTYQREIFTIKETRDGTKRTPAGYVDIHARVRTPSALSCGDVTSSSPRWEKQPADVKLCAPKWTLKYKFEHYLFDVRHALPPLALLVRELRTLRNIAEEMETELNDDFETPPIIVVVADSFPDNVDETLCHEGFWTLDRAMLREYLINSVHP